MRAVGDDERRARLGVRHRLAAAAKASDPVQAAEAMTVLHATDPASVFLSVQARSQPTVGVADVEQALYQDRALIRMLAMRRTMFVAPTPLAPVLQAACTNAVAVQQRRTYTRFVTDAGLGDEAWLQDVCESTVRALTALGEATGAQLSTAEPRLRSRVLMAEGKPYEAMQSITTWVLFMLAAEGRIVRGRPRGSWISSQWTWAPAQTWLPAGGAQPPAPAARAELVRRWLTTFGPGTLADLRWWTGWTAAQAKQAVAAVGAVPVQLAGGTGLLLPDDLEPLPEPPPWVALLPALDPTPMGWTQREWYLGDHAGALFDRNGNVGPTVWHAGRVVGGWAQRAGGEIVYRLLTDIGGEATAAVRAAADRLADWTGPVRVVPRFRTPLERELSA